MNRTTYACIVRAIAPLLAARVAFRARFDPLYGAAPGERFGYYGPDARRAMPGPVWVHAVSLGETPRRRSRWVQGLLDRGLPVLLTHMTATGRREGARLFAGAISRGQLRQSWLPYDLPGACTRFLAAMRPRCGILIEREVWPNLIHAANARGVPVMLASGRLSERSARRGRHAGSVLRDAYAGLEAGCWPRRRTTRAACARPAPAPPPSAATSSSTPPCRRPRPSAAWHGGEAWGRPVITVASTHEGEEAAFARALAARLGEGGRNEQALLVIVPRHPERFDCVAAQLQAAGLKTARRSRIDPLRPLPAGTQVLLGDSMGEMASYYAASDAAIVAGGFVPRGGQNLIEACATGTPVVVGPHTRHFKQATQEAIAAGAAVRAADAQAALSAALDLLADDRGAPGYGRGRPALRGQPRGRGAARARRRAAAHPRRESTGPGRLGRRPRPPRNGARSARPEAARARPQAKCRMKQVPRPGPSTDDSTSSRQPRMSHDALGDRQAQAARHALLIAPRATVAQPAAVIPLEHERQLRRRDAAPVVAQQQRAVLPQRGRQRGGRGVLDGVAHQVAQHHQQGIAIHHAHRRPGDAVAQGHAGLRRGLFHAAPGVVHAGGQRAPARPGPAGRSPWRGRWPANP